MDFDGDGIDDIISGSYMPGHLYLFRGTSAAPGPERFAKGVALTDAGGDKLLADRFTNSKNGTSLRSMASVPYAADIDADGDLDLLVGNRSGGVILIENEGSATEPIYQKKSLITVLDDELMVPGGDSGPVAVDWDDDGRLDLVIGAGDGSVWFYRNVGTPQAPEFTVGTALVNPGADKSRSGLLKPGEEPTRTGMRAKVCVTDYNGDGLLDLLVGDCARRERPEPFLNAKQLVLRAKLELRESKLNTQLMDIQQKFREKVDAGDGSMNDLMDDEEYKRIYEETLKLDEELAPLRAGIDMHGWVWLYVRRDG